MSSWTGKRWDVGFDPRGVKGQVVRKVSRNRFREEEPNCKLKCETVQAAAAAE